MPLITEEYDILARRYEKQTTEAILRLDGQLVERGCKFGDRAIPTFWKPYFLSQEDTDDLERVTGQIMAILEKVVKIYLEDKRLRSVFQLRPSVRKWMEIDPGYKRCVVIARPDSFLTPHGFRFIELNCDSPAGLGYADLQERLFCSGHLVRKLAERYEWIPPRRLDALLEALMACYREFGGNRSKPQIAIVDWKTMRTLDEFYIIQKYFQAKGYEAVVADPRDLKYRSGALYVGGFRVDLVYRRVIFDELMAKKKDVGDFLKAYQLGKVCVINPLRSKLAASKSLLSILTHSKYDSWFSNAEIEVKKKYIPWTRLAADTKKVYLEKKKKMTLRKLIERHQHDFVLKPSDSYGGKGVRIGRETTPKVWRATINRAFRQQENWVVQEYVPIPQMTVPVLNRKKKLVIVRKKMNINPYILGGKYAGAIARLSDESVINVSAGGGLIPVVTYSRKGKARS
ncbi:MAG: circularly permuted type 2 ATP-grasp protein [Candidatus Omnitrophica bacterium]|nr:circularly permuted type 2 ATP-grasp protein [Candidatus Omnitrophota bacterium]